MPVVVVVVVIVVVVKNFFDAQASKAGQFKFTCILMPIKTKEK